MSDETKDIKTAQSSLLELAALIHKVGLTEWHFAGSNIAFEAGMHLTLPRLTIFSSGSKANAAPPGQEYVDPYLFETGHFESREEYEELSRTAKIKPRARS